MSMIRVVLFIAFFLFCSGNSYAQFTLSGTVEDGTTGEKLAGATIMFPQLNKVEMTEAYGQYYFKLPPGTHKVLVQMLGYHRLDTLLALTTDSIIHIPLSPSPILMDGVSVSAQSIAPASEAHDYVLLSKKEMLNKGSFFLAEADGLKAIQKIPGVNEGSEGSAGLNVRGGSNDQNLILMDGVPLYNVFHLFGFLSVINPEAVQSMELIKGGMPARYGGRLSSVVNIHLKEGNKLDRGGKYTISPVSSSLMLEGPLVSDKASYLFSARRSWFDLIGRLAGSDIPQFSFYDIMGKAHADLNARNTVYLSLYNSGDKFSDTSGEKGNRFGFKWGNLTSIIRWNREISQATHFNLSASHTRYTSGQEIKIADGNEDNISTTQSHLEETTLRYEMVHHPDWASELRFGGSAGRLVSQPLASTIRGQATNSQNKGQEWQEVYKGALFTELQLRPFSHLLVQAGLRYDVFGIQGDLQGTLSPRLSLRQNLGKQWTIQGHFTRMVQPMHLLTNSTLGQPLDLWVNATREIPVQSAYQYAVGVEKEFSEHFSIATDLYYKQMKDVLAYKNGLTFLQDNRESWEELVTTGEGRAYGIETMVTYHSDRHSIEMAYTWSRSFRLFGDLNLSRPFPFKYDRPHSLTLSYSGLIGKNKVLSVAWTMQSGHTLTLPSASYKGMPPPLFEGEQSQTPYFENLFYTEKLNDARLPTHHRLDLSFRTKSRKKGKGAHQWIFSVYNAYNRLNPFFVYETNGELKTYALFPIIPSVGYSREF